ncbi:uncharacterized protein LOC135958698 [Calliphora vicina]|uniref:uncharacterized protein LOC135958698 n=1 Tax=Calliphora vicina TaxID=7373 RepID=UPI00325BB6D0
MLIKIFLIFLLNLYKVYGQSDRIELNLPQLRTENEQLFKGDNKEYRVSLSIPNSQRTELITLDPLGGHPIVKGSINTYYPDTSTNLIVNYVADQNGYRASFKITQTLPASSISFDTRLSSSDLKSLAG